MVAPPVARVQMGADESSDDSSNHSIRTAMRPAHASRETLSALNHKAVRFRLAQRERDFDGAARRDDAPTLTVNLDGGEPLGGVNQNPLHLLRGEARVRFEHACDH